MQFWIDFIYTIKWFYMALDKIKQSLGLFFTFTQTYVGLIKSIEGSA